MDAEIATSLAYAYSLSVREQRYAHPVDHVIIGHGGAVSFSGLTTREVCPTTIPNPTTVAMGDCLHHFETVHSKARWE